MDLRAQQPQHAQHGQQLAQQAHHPRELPEQGAMAAGLPHAGTFDGANSSTGGAWELLLMVGSQVAAEARRAVKVSHGYVARQAMQLHQNRDPPPKAGQPVPFTQLACLPRMLADLQANVSGGRLGDWWMGNRFKAYGGRPVVSMCFGQNCLHAYK